VSIYKENKSSATLANRKCFLISNLVLEGDLWNRGQNGLKEFVGGWLVVKYKGVETRRGCEDVSCKASY